MYKHIKRVLDFVLALVLLIVLAIPMAIIAIAIKLQDNGPVLFRQERTGKDGKNFVLLKFRSMVIENNVRDFSKGDQLTKVGRIVRATSLDELPQLFNILKGEMSFIGPRPWIPEYFEFMNEKQRGRVKVLPGITGLAQASGRNSLTILQKIDYDLKYVENYSFKQDISIIFKTIESMIRKDTNDIGKFGIEEEINTLKNQSKKEELMNA